MEGASLSRTLRLSESSSAGVDRALAELAGRQHGRVALWQVAEIGLKRSAVTRRVAAGRLHRVHPGVYAVGARVETRESACMSAVLACGPGAVLSHRSAAAHWGLRAHAAGAPVDVTVPTGRRGRYLRGIAAHHSSTIHPKDVVTVDGIPCTSVARTLLDLADVVDPRALERAIEEAERLRLFDGGQVREVLGRATGRRGAPVLEAVLAAYDEPTLARRELERLFYELCEGAGIERPRTQVAIELADGDTVFTDFLWPDAKLVVETDGRETHGTRQAFERDRRRDRRLMMLGYRVVRFTWLDIRRRREEVIRTVSALL